MEKLLGRIPAVVDVSTADDTTARQCRQIFCDVGGIAKFDVQAIDSDSGTVTIVHDFSTVNPLNIECKVVKVYKEYKSGTDTTAQVYKSNGTAVIGIKVMP